MKGICKLGYNINRVILLVTGPLCKLYMQCFQLTFYAWRETWKTVLHSVLWPWCMRQVSLANRNVCAVMTNRVENEQSALCKQSFVLCSGGLIIFLLPLFWSCWHTNVKLLLSKDNLETSFQSCYLRDLESEAKSCPWSCRKEKNKTYLYRKIQ